MGGHESKQSVTASVNVVGSAVQKVTQSCISYVDSNNTIAVDGNGNVLTTIDPLNHVTGNTYDALNRLVQVLDLARLSRSAPGQPAAFRRAAPGPP